MAIQTKCPSCGARGKVPDQARGQRVKCPSCGSPFTAEFNSPFENLDAPAELPYTSPPPVRERPARDPDQFSELVNSSSASNPKAEAGEPWFYRYLVVVAYAMMILTAIGSALWLIAAIFLLVRTRLVDNDKTFAAVAEASYLVSWFITCVVAAFWSALVLLLVDIGRKLRTIARNTNQAN